VVNPHLCIIIIVIKSIKAQVVSDLSRGEHEKVKVDIHARAQKPHHTDTGTAATQSTRECRAHVEIFYFEEEDGGFYFYLIN